MPKDSIDSETVAQNACIARSVGRAEMDKNEKTLKAKKSEWPKLWDQKVWGSTIFKNYHQVMYEAKSAGKYIHIGKLRRKRIRTT